MFIFTLYDLIAVFFFVVFAVGVSVLYILNWWANRKKNKGEGKV